ncbi:hypothetical protein HHI36_009137 [Cryptolaemus montrouzieri]|uniref:Uncharacterized protein n=1 Tax=Cryptolaemus montrouzieri TaxID=559131 RepID=A0ABD2MV82_9CUCU
MILETSPTDVIMISPSLSNCMNICNNNLFNKFQTNNRLTIDTVDNVKKNQPSFGITSQKHPGQAVKIGTKEKIEDKKTNKEVGSKSSSDARLYFENSKSANELRSIKTNEKNDFSRKSDESLKECKSCDENLIKFIFSKHGIQIISDVETIV